MRRYMFIQQHRERYPLSSLARTLDVSRSGFYEWRDRPLSIRVRRREALAERVRETFIEFDGISGSRKIARELIERDIQICRNTVASIMREMNLQSKAQRRRSFTVTTDSNHLDPIAPNVLGRDFTAEAPNEKWAADITFVPTDDGWMYLVAVMDLFSRRIVGWAVSDSLETTLVMEALTNAIETR